MGKTALLLGATGETGRELLRELVHAPAFDKLSKAPVGPCTGYQILNLFATSRAFTGDF